MANEELNQEDRESKRNVQLKILSDPGTKDLYVAGIGLSGIYGKEGEDVIMINYLRAMSNPSEHVGRMVSNIYALMARQAIQSGQDPGDTAGLTPRQLIKNARGIYESAIGSVKVSDILELMEIEKTHQSRIKDKEKDMYVEDLKETNKKLYNQLVSSYLDSLGNIGVGESIVESGKSIRKNLEKILSTPAESN